MIFLKKAFYNYLTSSGLLIDKPRNEQASFAKMSFTSNQLTGSSKSAYGEILQTHSNESKTTHQSLNL